MKLLYCTECGDIFSLDVLTVKECSCGKTRGQYLDNLNAEYTGDNAIPLGFVNSSLDYALENQPESGMGERFTAFVIPKECETFIKKP